MSGSNLALAVSAAEAFLGERVDPAVAQAVIVPGLVSAFGIFWMRQHIASAIDDELMQAARVDGATTWQIFWRIAFPLVRPAASGRPVCPYSSGARPDWSRSASRSC